MGHAGLLKLNQPHSVRAGDNPMLKYFLKRILYSIPLIIGVTLVIFAITRILPGDPARVIAGPLAPAEEVARITRRFGLDQPLYTQYYIYIRDLLAGDMGSSLRTGNPVSFEIFVRLPNTLMLIIASLFFATLFGVPLGVLAASKRNSFFDFIGTIVAMVGISMPVFWSGLLLILLFAVILQWLPAGGFGSLRHFIMPVFTLSFFNLANIMRVTRSSMLEILQQDYIRTAHSKGLVDRKVIYKHGLRNAMIPIVTLLGLQFGALLGGTILTETVFAWPGMGRLLIDSIFARDYTVLQGTVFIFSIIIVITNLLVDFSYGFIDPKVRYD